MSKGFILLAILLGISIYYFFTRTVVIPNELIAVQYHFLDSVNIYLKTGLPLMAPEGDRVDPDKADYTLVYTRIPEGNLVNSSYVPLEEVLGGDDQGYPFLLSIFGSFFGFKQVNYSWFIQFNYIFLIILGLASSFLLFFSFRSLILTLLFYYLYLFKIHTYDGWVDHHWMIGAFIPFYLFFIILFLKTRSTFKPIVFLFYFLVAGLANIIRQGDGIMGILIFAISLIIIIKRPKIKELLLKRNLKLIALFLIIYIFPAAFLTGVREWRDLKFFNGRHSDLPTHHLLWHHAFLGLGYIPNSYGIKYNDLNPMLFVRKIDQSVRLYSYEEDRILRDLYIQIILKSPDFWFSNLFAKIKAIHLFAGWLVIKVLPESSFLNFFKNYLLYITFLLIFLLSRTNKISRMIFWTLLVSCLISIIPGLIVVPSLIYLKAFQTVFFITIFYLIILVFDHTKNYLKGKLKIFNDGY